jgi:hypothetical protein
LGLNNDYPLYDIPFLLLWGISVIRFGMYEAYIYKKIIQMKEAANYFKGNQRFANRTEWGGGVNVQV